MDGEFPWILVGAFLLWVFNILGGKKRPKVERPRQPRASEPPVPARPQPRAEAPAGQLDPTQSEAGQLEELLRALERRLDPSPSAPPPPQAPSQRPRPRGSRPPLGRPASVPLPGAEDLEERGSLETEPATESLEGDIRRPERVDRDWLRQAEERERARLEQVEARDRISHKTRHAEFDRRIRAESAALGPAVSPPTQRLTTAQIRQAFIWGEILGRPKGDR